MAEKIFVLGSNSFSGASFSDYALQDGCEVIGVSRSPEAHQVFLPYKWHNQENLRRFRFYQMDLNRDLDRIMELINEFMPDYVVNFAAQSMVAESWQNPEHWMMTNVVSNVRFHDRLRKCSFLKKYVHVSTPEVYGTCEGLVQENTNYNPSTPYAVSRAACDMSLTTFFKNYAFPVVFTRAANVYGPGQQLYRIIPKTILSIKSGKRLPLHGGGHSLRSFIHIRDVADGTLRVARKAVPGEIYHLSTSRNISIRDLVRLICERMKVSFEEMVEITEDRPGKDAAYLLDSSKAKGVLGWSDKIGLEEGIEDTIRWVEGNIDVLKDMSLAYIHKP